MRRAAAVSLERAAGGRYRVGRRIQDSSRCGSQLTFRAAGALRLVWPAASNIVSAGKSLYVVGKVLGHAEPKTTQRYAHTAPESLLEAADKGAGNSKLVKRRGPLLRVGPSR